MTERVPTWPVSKPLAALANRFEPTAAVLERLATSTNGFKTRGHAGLQLHAMWKIVPYPRREPVKMASLSGWTSD
jgi:hypothetical protein